MLPVWVQSRNAGPVNRLNSESIEEFLSKLTPCRRCAPNPFHVGYFSSGGPVAQRLEQRTHNPLVLGSNPSGPTNKFLSPALAISWFSLFVHFPQIREHSRTKLPRPAPQRGVASRE